MTGLTLTRGPFNSVFDELLSDMLALRPMAPVGPLPASNMASITRARMDVVDKGSAFEIAMDLPGVKKEDIDVSIEGARVSVKAETKSEREEKEGEKLIHSERYAASYARSVELPAEVSDEGAQAKFENGVLTLTLPKRAQVMSKRLAIQ